MYTPSELRELSIEPIAESPAQKVFAAHASLVKWNSLHLPELLDKFDACLIDIRFAPPAQPIKWNKDYLKLLLKRRYRHVPALGNRGTTAKPLIHNLGLGIKIITELKINVLLFCACENSQSCHRHQIAKELARQGREVIEIEN